MSMIDLFQTGSDLYALRTVTGIRTGVVTESGHPEHMGQVKVEILLREEGSHITEWARVASPYAGKERGLCFLPETGDEVLVAFDAGNIHRPIVVGSLWNAGSDPAPPAALQGQKVIRTKSGHQITFQETPGSEAIEIKTPGEYALRLDEGSQSIQLKDRNGANTLEIDGQTGTVTVKGVQTIVMDAGSGESVLRLEAQSGKARLVSDAIEIEGTKSLSLKAPSMQIQASALDLSAASGLNLRSGGVARFNGAMIKIN
ncbi:MAG: phage baseplate assembly protein V [Peptococcaceae bacterium]|jgi:uncharacterized protein involved in type VI secretion and phage assembly|nr:phage baseplate assembly protein V [Peptococcaceae bacterium]